MPRPIHVPQGDPGISSYTLGPGEEWELRKVTFSLVALAGAGADNLAWFDMRDPSGGLILLQPLAPADGTNMFYSLAFGASEFNYPNAINELVPQDTEGFGNNYVVQRLSPETLHTGCAINVYKSLGNESPPTDPITNLSTFYSIPDLHLWVEDTAASLAQNQSPFPPPGPYMLVGGLNA